MAGSKGRWAVQPGVSILDLHVARCGIQISLVLRLLLQGSRTAVCLQIALLSASDGMRLDARRFRTVPRT